MTSIFAFVATPMSRITHRPPIAWVSLATSVALLSSAQAGEPGDGHRVAEQTAVAPVASDAAAAPRARGSYRRQLMVADGVATVTVAAAAAAGAWVFAADDFHLPMTVGGFGFTSYVITAPIIHWTHGRVVRGFLSGTVRVIMPALVAATAVSIRGLEERDEGYDATFLAGMTLGVVGAMAIDWGLLVPGDPAAADSPPRFQLTASAGSDSALVGLASTW